MQTRAHYKNVSLEEPGAGFSLESHSLRQLQLITIWGQQSAPKPRRWQSVSISKGLSLQESPGSFKEAEEEYDRGGDLQLMKNQKQSYPSL